MDLRVTSPSPASNEHAAVDSVLGPAESGFEGGQRTAGDGHVAFGGFARSERRRHLLLPVLHALQEKVGYVSHPAIDYACRRLDIAPAEAFGVASAYALFSFEPGAEVTLHVCDDICCRVAAGGDPCAPIEALLGPAPGNGTAFHWERSPCLGHCEHGSAALVQAAGEKGGRASIAPFEAASLAPGRPIELEEIADATALLPQLSANPAPLRLLRRVGRVDPRSIDSYRSAGGYEALRRAVELGPAGVIRELKDSKLLGRGGAAFPISAKWQAVAGNPERPHYFVVNADESEPGTFKDRVLLECLPHALVEAATIAGLTTGAERGFVYLRGEYPLAERRLAKAIAEARERGLLGGDVMGTGAAFDLELRIGAGAYIAGEETALFNSIEGKRPEPRNKPPYPTDKGLFGKPTGENNVETLYCVLDILSGGGEAFAVTGTPQSTGSRLFCLSGSVERPGLYEVPLGTRLSELLELAGGVRGGRQLAAVLLGGAAGSFVGPDDLDLELSFEGARAAGATLGSGVVMVVDDSVDLAGMLRRIAQFFRDESCGQCVPCRVGTVRQEEVLARLVAGRPLSSESAEMELLSDLDTVMRDASICGLGQTASSAVMSAFKRGLVGATAATKEKS
ncbi:MAG: NADH-ubiquinone oxidoreductase-F iron-sulfur binding region domain-containing protein [Acidimicrobiales bacterium]